MFVTVEGELDREVAARIMHEVGIEPYRIDIEEGKTQIKAMMPKICEASRTHPWLVLVDLDADDCPATLVVEFTRGAAIAPILRVAVREVEAWLLADRTNLAKFLAIATERVPGDPDAIADPKQSLINLARRSRSRAIREGIVPDPRTLRKTGPEYNFLLGAFVRESWDVAAAAALSDSLLRCVEALRAVA